MSESKVKCDVEGITFALNQIGERATRGISAVMKEEGENICEIAKSNAPVEDHDLENAIKMEATRTGVNGRTSVKVFIDETVTGDDGKPVGDYAMFIHEGLSPYGTGFAGSLGPKSVQKATDGNDVGGKFMTRALSERYSAMMTRIKNIVKGALG